MRYNAYILLLIFIGVGLVRYFLAGQTILVPESTIKCTGYVNRFPNIKNDYQQASILCEILEVTSNKKNTTHKAIQIKINTALYPQLRYGTTLQVQGKINKHNAVSYPQIKISTIEAKGVISQVYKFRKKLEKTVQQHLPSQNANLVIGTLLGSTDAFSEEVTDQLKKTGTIHMVVVSGYNVSLVAGLFLQLAGTIHRRYAIVLSVIAIFVFVIITGGEPPAMRAGAMGAIVLFGQLFGRKGSALYLLALTAAIFFAVIPSIISELSFQLSCLATAGVLIASDLLKKYKDKMYKSILSEIGITLSAQIAVAPLIALHFNQVSLVSPIANILVSWSIPYIMMSGVSLILVGVVSSVLAKAVSFIALLFTAYFLQIVKITAGIPLSSLDNIQINWLILISYYSFLILIITIMKRDKIYSKKEQLESEE